MSILLPMDWHSENRPAPAQEAEWLEQVPAVIAREHAPYLGQPPEWRTKRPHDADDDSLRALLPKELRRATITGFDESTLLELAARYWTAVERYLEAQRPEALLLWNSGNCDQNIWTMVAGQLEIPVMHAEHGWLPVTRIFDPIGSYVTGASAWDRERERGVGVWDGQCVMHLWREARLSKHAQGRRPSDEVRRFCAQGPALLVAQQLETDGSAVYHETQFASQHDFLGHCLTWPGPVLVKPHPVAARIEWEQPFRERRQACCKEVRERGGLWLGGNEDLHELLQLVTAVAALNSNVLFEAAMMGKQALSFGEGPHSGAGFTIDMNAETDWPSDHAQTEQQLHAVCRHISRMEDYLTPDGAWLASWNPHNEFWGHPYWGGAHLGLIRSWEQLLGEEQA